MEWELAALYYSGQFAGSFGNKANCEIDDLYYKNDTIFKYSKCYIYIDRVVIR